uniref:T-complex protein 1 subunit delta n=1 Tax=Oryza nivara TaxID=4536 RepID=A0A0E0IV12_ORYNI
MAAAVAASPAQSRKTETYTDNKRRDDVRSLNIAAGRAVTAAARTSLGPRGMDKMISSSSSGGGDQAAHEAIIITNDGATILSRMPLLQPAARMLADLSRSQDAAAGDGTTTVVVLAGSLLHRAQSLLSAGAHPTAAADALHLLAARAVGILHGMAIPKLGGTVDDTELIRGLVLDKKASHVAGGPTRIGDAKIAVITFQVSPPKTDIEHSVVVSDYAQMDRILREERNYILGMVKKIKASGCNVLLIQKSILRDSVNDLSLHYLAKAKIMVVKDVERDEIEFITKTLNCMPIASIEHLRVDKLGHAHLVEEISVGDGNNNKIVKITGIKNMGRTATVLVRGSNQMVIDEAQRSLHDAFCVIRCLVNKRFLIAGGGAPEIEMSMQLAAWAKELRGMESYCVREFAEALEVIPYTLSENAGLDPISIVTELRNRHAKGEKNAGINVRKGRITNILEENVVQPLLVSTSAITLACECVRMILKIDDIVTVR